MLHNIIKREANMSDLVNIIVNNGVAVVVVAYFLYKDNKFNNEFVKTLTEITTTLKEMQDDIKRRCENVS